MKSLKSIFISLLGLIPFITLGANSNNQSNNIGQLKSRVIQIRQSIQEKDFPTKENLINKWDGISEESALHWSSGPQTD